MQAGRELRALAGIGKLAGGIEEAQTNIQGREVGIESTRAAHTKLVGEMIMLFRPGDPS